MTEREVMEYDVVIVGAGPAGLACAIRLKQLKPDTNICVLEKGSAVGAHSLSGAVLEPAALEKLLPNWRSRVHRHESAGGRRRRAADDATGSFKLPSWAVESLADEQSRQLHRLARPAHAVAGAAGREARRRHLPGLRGGRSAVRRTAARSRACASATWVSSKDGEPGPNYTPGVEIHAGTTMLAEGSRGSISQAADREVQPARGRRSADVRPRLQGAVAIAARPRAARPHRARVRLAARYRRPMAAASSITSTTTACTSATSSA